MPSGGGVAVAVAAASGSGGGGAAATDEPKKEEKVEEKEESDDVSVICPTLSFVIGFFLLSPLTPIFPICWFQDMGFSLFD